MGEGGKEEGKAETEKGKDDAVNNPEGDSHGILYSRVPFGTLHVVASFNS